MTLKRDPLWLAVIPLLLLNVWLAARSLNVDALWLDEVLSLYYAGGEHFGPQPPLAIIQRVDTWQAPLYPLLNSFWGRLVGWTPFALRTGSLLAGALAIALTYRLGKTLVSSSAGLGAAAILSTSATFIYFQHEFRAYVASIVMALLVLWLYWRLLHAQRPSWLLYLTAYLSLIALIYMHYLGGIALVGLGVYHLLLAKKNHRWLEIVGLALLVGVFMLLLPPKIIGGILNDDTGPAAAQSLDALTVLVITGRLFSSGVLALLTLLVVSAWATWQRRTWSVWVFAAATVGAVLLANAAINYINPGRERYLLVVFPLLALVAGTALAVNERPLRWIATLGVLAWMGVGVAATLQGDLTRSFDGAKALPWDTVAATLHQSAQDGDVVAVHGTDPNWVMEIRTAEYYLHGLPVEFTLLESLPKDDDNAEVFTAAARAFINDAPHVWLGVDERRSPRDRLTNFVDVLEEENYLHCDTVFDAPNMHLDLYWRVPRYAIESGDAGLFNFEGGIALTYLEPLPQTVRDQLDVTAVWTIDDSVPDNTYSVGLYVVDSAGSFVRQADYGLPTSAAGCVRATLPLTDLPPGDYDLRLRVYNWATDERLRGNTALGAQSGETLTLWTFAVE